MPDIRPSFGALVGKTFARARNRGPREVAGTWTGMLRQLASSDERLIFFYQDLGEGTKVLSRPPPPGVTFRAATAADATQYARDIGTDSAATFAARLSDKTRCFVVVGNGAFLHASWITTAAAWTRELQRYFCPPPDQAYIYESFTRPETRGRGIYPFALESICVWLTNNGLQRAWVGVEDGNQSSLRAVSKAGFELGFHIDYRRRLGRLNLGPLQGPMAGVHDFLSTSPDCRPG
jgi:RimJ/RimL family protein N-acetyltransferase